MTVGEHLYEARPPNHVTMCSWVGPNRSEGLLYHHDFVDLGWDSTEVMEVLTIGQNLINFILPYLFYFCYSIQRTIWVIWLGNTPSTHEVFWDVFNVPLCLGLGGFQPS